MKYLVDANILSEPTRASPSSKVIDWLRRNERQIVVDPIVLGEVRYGILLLPKGRKRAGLEAWFDEGVRHIRCLSWDAKVGLRWAELIASLRTSGRTMPIKDSLVAATALTHGLTIATHNLTDFENARVRTLDPFA